MPCAGRHSQSTFWWDHSIKYNKLSREGYYIELNKGLLLVRVRDTLRMTFAAYQTLYSGSVVFGVKKAL